MPRCSAWVLCRHTPPDTETTEDSGRVGDCPERGVPTGRRKWRVHASPAYSPLRNTVDDTPGRHRAQGTGLGIWAVEVQKITCMYNALPHICCARRSTSPPTFAVLDIFCLDTCVSRAGTSSDISVSATVRYSNVLARLHSIALKLKFNGGRSFWSG